MSAGWLTSAVQPVEQASDEWEIVPIATPVINAGDVATDTTVSWLIGGNGVVITPDCENVELAARYLDFWYSEAGILLSNFGKEGVSYTMVNGVPTFTDEDEWLDELKQFIDTLKTVEKVEILPYHSMGVVKYEKLGISYPLKDMQPPEKDRVENAKKILRGLP